MTRGTLDDSVRRIGRMIDHLLPGSRAADVDGGSR